MHQSTRRNHLRRVPFDLNKTLKIALIKLNDDLSDQSTMTQCFSLIELDRFAGIVSKVAGITKMLQSMYDNEEPKEITKNWKKEVFIEETAAKSITDIQIELLAPLLPTDASSSVEKTDQTSNLTTPAPIVKSR